MVPRKQNRKNNFCLRIKKNKNMYTQYKIHCSYEDETWIYFVQQHGNEEDIKVLNHLCNKFQYEFEDDYIEYIRSDVSIKDIETLKFLIGDTFDGYNNAINLCTSVKKLVNIEDIEKIGIIDFIDYFYKGECFII